MPLDKLFYSREIVQAMSKYTHKKRRMRQGKSTKYAPAEAAKTQPRFEQPKSDKYTNKKCVIELSSDGVRMQTDRKEK